jgi:hypothetical protein
MHNFSIEFIQLCQLQQFKKEIAALKRKAKKLEEMKK